MNIFNNANIVYSDLKNIYNKNYRFLITIISSFMLFFFIRSILGLLDTLFEINDYPIQRILFMISSTCLIMGLEIGFSKLIFNVLDNKKVSISNIFNYFYILNQYIQGIFLFYGIIIISLIPVFGYMYLKFDQNIFLILSNAIDDPYYQEMIITYFNFNNILLITLFFIIPLLYISIRLFLWSYFVIDKEMDGFRAIKNSFQITKHKTLEIACYFFMIIIFNIIGLLSIIGICFTIPLTYIFLCRYYRLLIQNTNQL